MNQEEYIALASEINELETILAQIPADRVIDRMSFETRLNNAKEAIARINPKNLPKKARLTFSLSESSNKEHQYNNDMTDDAQYSIVFHTVEDFNKALEMTKILLPNDIDARDIEMFWTEEWWRDQAVHELDQVGIKVDTFTL